jgi:hypothetical protein
MFKNSSGGSTDNEAVKIANAFKPFWKKWTKEWGRNCVRSKKMTVSTAPSISSGLIGVKDAFSDTECMIPYQMDVANAQVGDTVWVRWMYDNQQTMYAESMGNIKSQQYTTGGYIEPVLVAAGGNMSFQIVFDKPFSIVPSFVASPYSSQVLDYGLVGVHVSYVSEEYANVYVVNNASQGKRVGISWIATGILSDADNMIVEQSSTSNQLYIY